MSVVRTFIGVHLSEPVLDNLAALEQSLAGLPGGRAARWVPRDNIHLTLKFLGDVESERLPAVFEAVARAVAPFRPFAVEVADVGCFPNTRRPRIVWAGLRGQMDALRALHQAVEGTLAPLGYARDGRPYAPHLTIGRVNRRATPEEVAVLGRTIADHGPVSLGTVPVAAASVIRSDLRPAGPIYTDLAVAPLEGVA